MVHFSTIVRLIPMALLLLLTAEATSNATNTSPALAGVGFDQKLNAQIPLDLSFTDDTGSRMTLKQYFGTKPVVLVLAYYQCPRLCTLVLNGLVQSMLEMNLDVGKDFNVVTLSFDPRENWQLAASKKEAYLGRYRRREAKKGWHFLTGEPDAIKQLTDAVGFHYRYDADKDQFIHASGIMVLTPKGRISRYFYDVQYPARELRLGLVEASHNQIGSPIDQILLYCFHYDASVGKYSAQVMNLVVPAGCLLCSAFWALYSSCVAHHDPKRSEDLRKPIE